MGKTQRALGEATVHRQESSPKKLENEVKNCWRFKYSSLNLHQEQKPESQKQKTKASKLISEATLTELYVRMAGLIQGLEWGTVIYNQLPSGGMSNEDKSISCLQESAFKKGQLNDPVDPFSYVEAEDSKHDQTSGDYYVQVSTFKYSVKVDTLIQGIDRGTYSTRTSTNCRLLVLGL